MARRFSSIPASDRSRPKVLSAHVHQHDVLPQEAKGAARALLSAALRLAMVEVGAEGADVAFWCHVDPRTVRRWLSEDEAEPAVDVRAVMNSKRLRVPFARALFHLLNGTESGRSR
jgi:hypothetical protein